MLGGEFSGERPVGISGGKSLTTEGTEGHRGFSGTGSAANSNDRHHASGLAFFGAVGEELVGMAVGAERRGVDVLLEDTGGEQLLAVGFDQIQKNLDWKFAVSGSARGEEEQRIFFADRVGFLHFVKQAGGVGELRFEFGANVFSDRVAAVVDAGADGGFEVARASAEVAEHFSYTFFDDALDRAAPSGVEDADGVVPGVDEDDGEAVGGLDGEQQAGGGGDESIAGEGVVGDGVDMVDEVGVDLAECDEGIELRSIGQPGAGVPTCCDLAEEGVAVAFDGGAGGVRGESDIALGASGESVEEPGFGEMGGAEEGWLLLRGLIFFADGGGHGFMVQDGVGRG
jgi:hypothetical protein